MKIILIRHGKSQNDKLTKEGKKQVKLAVKQLKNFKFKQIISSPLNRCKETAKIICKRLKCEFEINDDLRERWQLGHDPITNEEKLWWDNYLNYEFKTTLKESCKDFLDRNFKVFNLLKEKFCDDDYVLLVAHGATSYALLNYVIGIKNPIQWMEIGNANFIFFEI